MRAVLHGAGEALAAAGAADLGVLVLALLDARQRSGCAFCIRLYDEGLSYP